jgi:hypothetical protein
MPKIFEIFSYPIEDDSAAATENRRQAKCAFMKRDCDGGGNRYLSDVDLSNKPELKTFFRNRDKVRAGVCSIKLGERGVPWIVCPRRLLALNRTEGEDVNHQAASERRFLGLMAYEPGTRLGVWSEVKLAYRGDVDGIRKHFNYTFDYVLVPVGLVSATVLEETLGLPFRRIRPRLIKNGYALSMRDNQEYVEDFPVGAPTIVEIMTSSTSGGNKKYRSTIPMAFEDVILDKQHNAPSINFRQVWARMVSQLIVKSEVGLSWGGKCIWLLQDVLIDYICESTALNIRRFLSANTSEVNMLSFSYGREYENGRGVIQLAAENLFAGPMAPPGARGVGQTFQDMVRAPIRPPLSRLWSLLSSKRRSNILVV